MIAYTTLGTNDLERAGAFYDALLEGLELRRLFTSPRFIAWGTGPGAPKFCLCRPFDDADA